MLPSLLKVIPNCFVVVAEANTASLCAYRPASAIHVVAFKHAWNGEQASSEVHCALHLSRKKPAIGWNTADSV